jgi:hypothetical protein
MIVSVLVQQSSSATNISHCVSPLPPSSSLHPNPSGATTCHGNNKTEKKQKKKGKRKKEKGISIWRYMYMYRLPTDKVPLPPASPPVEKRQKDTKEGRKWI